MKQLLFSLMMLTLNISSVIHGQVNCWPVPIQPANDPFAAPTVCLEEVCFISNAFQTMEQEGFCGPGTRIDNPHYLRFQGIGEPIEIYVESMDCVFDNPIEIAILDALDWTHENVIACQTIQAGTGDTLTFTNGVAGATYLLLIDVTPPDMCSFYIDAVGGVASAPLTGNLTQISGPSTLCPGDDTLTLQIEGNVTNANGYVWNASWQVSEMMTTSSVFQIPVSDLPDGNQSICAYATNVCDISSTVCFNFSVNPVYETFIDTSLCYGETFTYNGVLYDENNSSGTEFYTNADGCDSVVMISVLYPGPDTTLLAGGFCIQDSFSISVNGTVYDLSNPTGEEVLSNAMGCDSIIIVDLEFHAVTLYADSFQLCSGEPFPATGLPVYQDTFWIDTFFNAGQFGCDSIVEYFLDVLPVEDDTIYAEICSGDSISVHGIFYGASGIHETILTGVNGCDSIVTLNLSVLPPDSVLISQKICAGDSLVIMDSTLFSPGMYTFSAGPGQVGCDSIVVIELEILENIEYYDTYPLCPGDSVQFGDTVLFETGLYRFDAGLASNGCDSSYILEIITPALLVPDTAYIHLCPGDSITLLLGVEEVTIDSSAIVLDTAIANGFLCDSALVYVIAFADSLILDSVEIAPDNGTGSGGIMPYFNDPVLAFAWSSGQSEPGITGLSPGTYGLTVTDINGCINTFSFTVPLSTGVQEKWQGSAPLLVQNPIEKGDPIRIQPGRSNGQVDLIRLYALNGDLVSEWTARHLDSSGQLTLHGQEIGSGMYMLQMRQRGIWFTRKLIIL